MVILLDQLTKLWIVREFVLYESRVVVPGLFNLTYLTNNGAAFSMLAGTPALWRQVLFITIALVALILLVIAHHRFGRQSAWYTVGMALIAGGAVGNLIDRVRQGAVIDFLDVYVGDHHWPAFNVADAGITIGVTVFIFVSVLFDRADRQQQVGDR